MNLLIIALGLLTIILLITIYEIKQIRRVLGKLITAKGNIDNLTKKDQDFIRSFLDI